MNAIGDSAHYERAQAYGNINRAIDLESSQKVIPKYLALKAKIEIQMGYSRNAESTLYQAQEIIKSNPSYWSKSNHIAVVAEIERLLKQIEPGNFQE